MPRSRSILIGDVHGCLAELQALLRCIAPRSDDTFVLLGDLVDKGPNSPVVVRWVRHFSTVYRVVLIEGNHEAELLRADVLRRASMPVRTNLFEPQMLQTMVPWLEVVAFLHHLKALAEAGTPLPLVEPSGQVVCVVADVPVAAPAPASTPPLHPRRSAKLRATNDA